MRRIAISSEEKRLTLRISQELWRQLRREAARRDMSAMLLINQLIEERLGELGRDGLGASLDRLEALRERPAGWNGYDALAPDPGAISFAEAWLSDLYQEVTAQGAVRLAPHVTSSAEGEVVFEWWNDSRKLTVYCTSGDASFVKDWGPDMVTQMEDGDATAPTARQEFWRWLRE
jgi:hypothetical protein